MNASSVIADVTQTLQDLLTGQQQPAALFDVSLKSPADETIDATMKPKVNLFLFRVSEDPFAKNQEWIPVADDTLQFPPLALDLFYVMTVFAEDKLDEHRVLGEAMRILHDFALLQPPLLKNSLAGESNLRVSLSPLTLEDLARIWTAIAKPYMLSVAYEVRVVLVDSSIQQPASRVTQMVQQYTRIGK